MVSFRTDRGVQRNFLTDCREKMINDFDCTEHTETKRVDIIVPKQLIVDTVVGVRRRRSSEGRGN